MTMFELVAALFVILVVVGVIALAATLIGFVFELLFLPFALIGGFIKFVVVSILTLVGIAIAVVVGPILLAIAAVFLVPMLLLGGVVWAVAAAV
jgi:hypothetical protein